MEQETPLLEYIGKAASTWFVGFFPLAEIYVAVPAGIALGLDDASIILWAVLGNASPALLISLLYEQLLKLGRFGEWLQNLVSEKAQERVNRWGFWFVLLATPWTGVWIMSVTAKTLGMNSARYIAAASVSILIYAILILLSIRTGASFFFPNA